MQKNNYNKRLKCENKQRQKFIAENGNKVLSKNKKKIFHI